MEKYLGMWIWGIQARYVKGLAYHSPTNSNHKVVTFGLILK
jgi:hypothetical protein